MQAPDQRSFSAKWAWNLGFSNATSGDVVEMRVPLYAARGRLDAVRARPNCYHEVDVPTRGAVAQLGARVNGIHEVRGSIPLSSTNLINNLCR